MTKQAKIEARAKAFSGEGVKTHKFLVESDSSVLVWDSVAGYYTGCHSLTESARKRIVRKAAESQRLCC